MEGSSEPESLSSCRNVSDVAYYVRNKVELCIQNYMSFEVTAKFLEKNHKIRKSVTQIVWEQLREENPDFFNHFELRCQVANQMRMYNDMLTKQAVQMFEDGLIDICDASPSVKALLRQQQPERVHLLETLGSKRKLSSASLVALPYANGPSGERSFTNGLSSAVAQSQILPNQQEQVLNPNVSSAAHWQIPNEQLNEQHLYASSLPLPYSNGPSVMQQGQHLYTTSLPMPYANGSSMTQLPAPYDQQNQDPFSTYNDLIPPTFAPENIDEWLLLTDPPFDDLGALPDTTIQWPSPDDLAYTPAMPEADLSLYELGGDLGHNGPSFMETDTILARMLPNEQQQQHLNGHYQPHWQQQQQQQNVQVQGSNGELLCNNFDMQQAGGVEGLHQPESEALHIPHSGVIRHNGPSFPDTYMEPSAPLLVIQKADEQIQQHLNRHLQVQQNVQVVVEAQQTMQSRGRNNELINGERSNEQSGGVQCHYPESQALNNPDTGVIGHNGPSDSYIKSAAQIVTEPQDQNGHYKTQENSGGGRSNGVVVNGESSGQRFCNNFDRNHSKRECTSVVEKEQAGRVKRHHPDSEALNNAE